MKSYLSLGSNIEPREEYLRQALDFLAQAAGIRLLRVSRIYETEPWGGVEQDDYLNLVAEIDTVLTPDELLKVCQSLELSLGRERNERWGPRTIDIDILLMGELQICTEALQIPHPYLEQREFVLVPLKELAENLRLPSGKYLREIVGQGRVVPCNNFTWCL